MGDAPAFTGVPEAQTTQRHVVAFWGLARRPRQQTLKPDTQASAARMLQSWKAAGWTFPCTSAPIGLESSKAPQVAQEPPNKVVFFCPCISSWTHHPLQGASFFVLHLWRVWQDWHPAPQLGFTLKARYGHCEHTQMSYNGDLGAICVVPAHICRLKGSTEYGTYRQTIILYE